MVILQLQKKKIMTMSKSWSRLLLSLFTVSALTTSCKREYSPDKPPTPVYAPSIIVGSDNVVVYALDPATGDKNWELAFPSPLKASPLLYGNFVYLASSLGDTLYKVNAKTGEIVKKITYAGGGVGTTATPIADANLIYLASLNGSLYAIDTGAYTTKWSYATGGSIQSSPVIYNGNVYIANTVGSIFCLEKTNGNPVPGASPAPTWSLSLPAARFVSSPAIYGTSPSTFMYIGSQSDSNMYSICVDVLPTTSIGTVRWTYKTKGPIISSPTMYGGYCIFGSSDFKVYCLDTTLDVLHPTNPPDAKWINSNLGSEVTSSPFVVNQTVYVGCKDYKLYALKMLNGQTKWAFSTKGVITSSPIVYNGTAYIGSYDKNIYAVDTAYGTLKWSKNVNGQITCSPVIDDFSRLTGFNTSVSGYVN